MDNLLEQAIQGNQDAYVKLMDLLRTDLYRIATARLTNSEDINDAIHETILKSYKYLHKLKHKEYFKTWIIKILINECNNIYYYNLRQISLINRIIYSKGPSKKTEIELAEDKMDFEKLLSPLNYNEKIIAILYYNNNFTPTEIADILNISINTVKTRLRRLKIKIESEIKKGGNETYEKTRK